MDSLGSPEAINQTWCWRRQSGLLSNFLKCLFIVQHSLCLHKKLLLWLHEPFEKKIVLLIKNKEIAHEVY